MRKLLILTASVALLFTTACDKKKDNNNAFSPNSCYATGGANQYARVNGICVDLRNQQRPVAENLCLNSQVGFNYDPRCSQYGFGNNPYQYGGNQYNWGGFTPIYGDNTCINAYGFGWITTQSQQTGQLRCEYVGGSQFGGLNNWNSGYVYGWIGLGF